MWWFLGFVTAVLVVGYVAHKFPSIFGSAVDTGATVVNKVDNQVKDIINKK